MTNPATNFKAKNKAIYTVYAGVILAFLAIGALILRSIDRTISSYSTLGLVVLAFVGVCILLWYAPKLQTANIRFEKDQDKFNTENEARKSFAQLLGGIAFLATFYVTWANLSIERDKAATEEFTKAVEQISKDEIPVRVGGAYALERLSRSSSADYENAINVLAEAVRERQQVGFDARISRSPMDRPHGDDDQQVIMLILGRRLTPSTNREKTLNLSHADLRGIFGRSGNFDWVDFDGADLRTASFYGTHLDNASFIGARADVLPIPDPNLAIQNKTAIEAAAQLHPQPCSVPEMLTSQMRSTSFAKAQLEGALFDQANLTGTTFNQANLQKATFRYAQLQRANFEGADVTGADFSHAHLEGANLTGAKGLTQSQLGTAITDACTVGIPGHPSPQAH